MFNAIKSKTVSVKNHVKRQKAAYAMGAVAITAIALQQSNLHAFNEFLTEKGIDLDEFYCPEAFAEKMN